MRHDILFEKCQNIVIKHIVHWLNIRSKDNFELHVALAPRTPRDREYSKTKSILSGDHRILAKTVRDSWIHRQLKLREHEFTEPVPFTAVLFTWNVNSKFPKDSIAQCFNFDKHEADFYIFGYDNHMLVNDFSLQEVDMSIGGLWYEETDLGVTWDKMLTEMLAKNCKNKYVKVLQFHIQNLQCRLLQDNLLESLHQFT